MDRFFGLSFVYFFHCPKKAKKAASPFTKKAFSDFDIFTNEPDLTFASFISKCEIKKILYFYCFGSLCPFFTDQNKG